jgi:hypothetical protein
MASSTFHPRSSFPALANLPRSYFLGHHRAGLSKMKTMLSTIDLVIECRDYRVPLTSINPLFEESLAGRERLIVYTKQDLGSNNAPLDRRVRPFSSILLLQPSSLLNIYCTPERRHHPHVADALNLHPILSPQARPLR